MEPTYPSNSIAWTLPSNGKVKRGDVVVIRTGKGRMIKRVAFVAGDPIVRMEKGKYFVDVVGSGVPSVFTRLGWKKVRTKVPDDCIYVLGDHAVESVDSRLTGVYSLDEVERVVLDPRPRLGARSSIVASMEDRAEFL